MVRLSPPSRAVCLAGVAALAAMSGGVGASWAQAPVALPTVQPIIVDPVSAAVAEASRRFGVPADWIWSVMRVESAGRIRAVSHAGAIGLMQVMPQTYVELRSRYDLGPDPFDVRDNVLAGTAYLREMHDRYGVQGMLAAYNAGPGRWEAYVRAGRRLPAETVGYLARLAPEVGAVAVPITSFVQPVRVIQAPRQTLFVQIGRVLGAALLQSDEPARADVVTGQEVAPEPLDALFVNRSIPNAEVANFNSHQRRNATSATIETTSSKPANSLFVPLTTAEDRP